MLFGIVATHSARPPHRLQGVLRGDVAITPPFTNRLGVTDCVWGDGDGVSQSVLKVPRRSATEKLKRISLITPEYVGIGSEVESYT